MISPGMMERRVRSLVRAAERGQKRVKAQELTEDEFPAFLERRGWRVLSPGGAAAVVRLTRAAVYYWIKQGHVRAWTTRRGEVYVDVGDVVRFALKKGYEVPRGWRKYAELDE